MPLTNEAKEKRRRRIESGEYTPSKPSFTPVSKTYKNILARNAESPSLSNRSTRPRISRTGSSGYSAGTKYNYQSTDQNEWSTPQYTAYARLNNDDAAIDAITYSNSTRGTRHWNPYRGGGAVLPEDLTTYWRDRGYEGPFDQNFVNQMNAQYGDDVSFTRTLAVATPTRKSSELEWAGYYTNLLANALHDNDELNQQYGDVLKQYSDFYDQYKQINGREPSLEEFSKAVDISKFSKLQAIDDSLVYGTKIQMLPGGTFYSPDIVPGIYHAKQQGKDLNINTDYFEDAVQYWMNPVQNAPSVQKYDWSKDDLSAVSQEDRDKYIASLKSQGLNEEAADYKYSWWAAQPHDDGIASEPSILDSAFGYYHNREWHDKVIAKIGDEYNARLNYDGTMDNPGKSGDQMDKACYELYQVNKTYDATNEIEDEWNALVDKAVDYSNRHLQDYNADQYEDFVFNMLDELGISQSAWDEEGKNLSELSSGLNDYLKNGYDANKHCRELNISKANLNTIFKRLWDGEEVRTGVDYAADVDEDYEPHHGEDKPDELPVMYNEQQRAQANQRTADRAQAEQAIVQSTLDFADSGAQAEKGSVNVVTDTFARMADLGDALYGVLAKVWKDTRQDAHNEKIGEEHNDTEAAAIDPVLNQLDVDYMPEQITVDDIKKLADAYVMSRAFDDDITLVHGILGHALPGIEYLHNAMMDNPDFFGDAVGNAIGETFNTLTYKNVYEDRVQSGYSEEEAASTAYFAATTVDSSVNEMTERYAGDEELETATSELINDISNEDGAKDTYTLLEAVSDDIREYQRTNNGAINPDLKRFYSALLIGASARSGAGFRAETNQMLHDIIVGDVTPQDILEATGNAPEEEAVDFGNFLGSLEPATETEKRLGPASDVKLITLSNGRVLTEGQYDTVIGEAKDALKKSNALFTNGTEFDNLSDDLKSLIGYDSIRQAAINEYGEDSPMVERVIKEALDNLANPYKAYHPSAKMENVGTNFMSELEEIGSIKDEATINANKTWAEEFNINHLLFEGDFAGALSAFATSDVSGITSAILSYFPGYEQAPRGKMVDLFRTYGKWLSPNEITAAWNSFSNGTASYDDVEKLVLERFDSVSNYTVNAMNNPRVLEKDYATIDSTLERLGSYSAAPANPDEIAQRLLDGESVFDISEQYPDFFNEIDTVGLSDVVNMRGVLDDAEVLDRIKERLRPYNSTGEQPDVYTPEQLDTMTSLAEFYKELGEDGWSIGGLDNEALLQVSNGIIDLDAAGFSSPAEVMNILNPEWQNVYGINPGTNLTGSSLVDTVSIAVGEGLVKPVLELPAFGWNLVNHIVHGALGQTYDSNADYTELGRAYTSLERQSELGAARDANVMTKAQAFIKTGLSEFFRNTVTSAIGGQLASAIAEAGGITMYGLSVANSASDALNTASSLIGRAPFATSVFLREFNDNIKQGKTLINAFNRAVISSGIEMLTEDLPFEKLYSKPFGRFTVGDHALSAIDTYGNRLIGWGKQTAKNILTEISEEEASEFLGRIVDTAENTGNGMRFSDALASAFEGYDKAAKDTAISTAFTTLLFGAVDLGGMTADYYNDYVAGNTRLDFDTLMDYIEADYAINGEEGAPSVEDIARTEREGVMSRQQTEETETEEAPIEETTSTPEPASDYNPATDVPFFGKKAQAAQKTLDEAVSSYAKEQTKENGKAVQEALEGVQTAMEEDGAEAAQEAAEQAAEQAAAEAEQDTKEEQEEPVQAVPELSEGAQRVQKFLEHADAAMDEAVVNKGAEIQAAKAVEEDPGLRSMQSNIDRLESKSEESAQKIEGMQQTSRKITGQLKQVFEAAFSPDVHLDENAPQVMDARNKKVQAKAAVESDIATEQEKKASIDRETEDAQKKMDEEKERIEREARETAIKKYRKQLADHKKRAMKERKELNAEKKKIRRNFFARTIDDVELSPQQSARLALQDMNLEDEKELNAQRARRNGSDVHSLYTDEQYRANRKAVADEQEAATELYEAELPETAGISATEAYTDPRYYTQKSVVSDRRAEEWQDAAKQRQDHMTSAAGMEEEQQERLSNQFQEYIERNAPANYIPVSYGLYKKVMDQANAQPGTIYNDRRYGYVASEQNQAEKDNLRPAEVVSEDALEKRQIYTAEDIMDDRGNLTGLGAQAFLAADPSIADNPETRSVNPSNGGTDISLEYFNENDRYLIVREARSSDYYDKAPEKSDEQRTYEDLTQKNHTGTIGLYRAMKRMEAVQKRLGSAVSRLQAVIPEYTQAKAEFDEIKKNKNANEWAKRGAAIRFKKAAKDLKSAEKDYSATISSRIEMRKQLDDMQEFIRNYTPVKDTGKVWTPQKYYVLDKSMLPQPKDMVELGAKVQADVSAHIEELIGKSDEELADMVLQNALGQLGDLPEDSRELMEQMAKERIKGMNRNDLVASITSNLASTYKQKRLAEMYKGAVQVFNGGERIDKFIEEHGGTNDENVGGPGFSTFISRDHYNPGNVYLISDEAALRFLSKKEQGEIGLNRTAAQYNAYINSTVNAFAKKNGLSDEQAAALRGAYGIGKQRGSRSLVNSTSSAIAQDDDHILAVPEKTIGVPKTNTFIREADGSYSPELAKWRLQRQLDWMVEQSNAEEAGDIDPNTNEPAVLNLKDNSIDVYFVDEHGESHKARVGEYYGWYKGGSKYFPSFEELMANADKIVCNFPCEQKHPGYNNYHTLVQFTLVPTSDVTQGHALSAELNTADYGAEQSELGHRRGHRELKEEFDKFVERFEALKGLREDDPIKRAARRAGMNATLDLYKNELRTALTNAGYATKDKLHYWQEKAVDLKMKIDDLAERLISANNSNGNSNIRETNKRIDRDRKFGYDKYESYPGFGTPAEADGKGLGAYADRLANEEAISNLRMQRGRHIFANRYVQAGNIFDYTGKRRVLGHKYTEPGLLFKGEAEYRNELGRIDSEIARRQRLNASIDRQDVSRFDGRIRNGQYMETVRGRERTRSAEATKLEPTLSAAERLKMAEERYEELASGEGGAMYDLPFFDVEKASLATIIPMLRQQAEQEAANAPAEQQPPKQPDPMARAIAEEMVKDESAREEQPAISDIGLTPTGEKPKATVGTVKTVNPDDFDETYAIVRSMRRPKKGVTQVSALSPSNDLFHKYLEWKKNGEWNEQTFREKYVPQFLEEMKQPEARKALNDLYQKIKEGKNVALTCFCEDESLCHRSIIAGLLQGAGADVTTESGADYSKYYDMYKGQIGEEQKGSVDAITKLAVLKDLSDSGADIDDIRTQETEKFHEAQMKDMSDEEKLDYAANLANQAATGSSSPLIDPNTDYDAKLGEVIDQQAQKNNNKQQRRMKAISRTVYKTERGINNALAELDEFEKAGHDVSEARDALNKQLEGLRNPNQDKIDAVVDSVEEPAVKMNLKLFSDTTTEAAVNDADAAINSTVDAIFDGMSASREIVTGFESETQALHGADAYIYSDSDLAEFEDIVVAGQQRLNDIRDEISDINEKIETVTSKWEKAELIKQRKSLKEERDRIEKVMGPATDVLLGSRIVDNAVANQAAFGPAGLQGDGEAELMGVHRERRQKSNENANKLADELHKNTPIHGKNTIYTTEELANAFGKVIDEEQLAQNRVIANAFNQRVKKYKTDIATIELAKVYASGDIDGFDVAFDKACQTIYDLHPEREYTKQEWNKNQRVKENAKKKLQEYIESLRDKYSVDLEGDELYKVLDQQRLILESAIERAERISKNYYKISARGLADVFHGEHGGHKPMQIIQTNYSLIRNSIKKWRSFHPISVNFNSFPGFCRKVLGKSADIFISQFVEPVRVAEGKAVRLRREFEEQYKWMRSLDKETRSLITQARHYGWTEEYIRRDHADKADNIIKGVETAGRIFDTLNEMINVVYGRNGVDLLKRRNNYIPMIPLEKNPILRALGIHSGFEEIPLKDFGKTSEYVPIHEFFRFAYERKSNDLEGCETDIVNLLDIYLPSAMTQIFQTDNIVAMRDMIDCIRENGDYDDLGRVNQGGYSFVTAFEDYCDVVSGKKVGHIDRAIERNFGRKYFNTVKALTQIVGQSATGANANVIAANFEPLIATLGTNPVQVLRAIHDTVLAKTDGTSKNYINNSDYLTVRLDEKNKAKTTYQKAVQKLYKPAEWSDAFVSEVIHRAAYYNACERLGINPEGSTILHKKARQNADNYCINTMASKGRGEKAGVFNTSHGSVIFQYMQESINNIRHLTTDLSDYAGNNAESIGKITGTAKALAALIAALLGHEFINFVTGNDTLPAVATPTIRAIKNRDEKDTLLDTAGDIVNNLVEGLNPFNNLLDNNSDIPIIGGVPVVSNIEQTIKGAVSTAEKAFNAIYGSATGKEFKPNETDWAYTLASTILKWAPAGTQVKRGLDTAIMADRGYTLSQKGRLKYAFNPTPGNIALSSIFGPNSSIEGREYVNSGYATQSDSNTDVFLQMKKFGMNPRIAYNSVKYDSDAKKKKSEAEKAAKFGEDATRLQDEAMELRKSQGVPKDIAPNFYGDVEEPWMLKALEMWQETGEITYPTDLNIYSDEKRGYYIKANNQNIPIDEATVEKVNSLYHQRAAQIIQDNKDPVVIKKALNDLKKRLKEKLLGGEYDGEDEDTED